jgi:hypothetical protein
MVDYYIFDHGPSKQNLTISNNSFVWIRGHLRERDYTFRKKIQKNESKWREKERESRKQSR